MAFQKLPPVIVLPGGRKVRDVSGFSPEKAAEQAQDYAGDEEEELEQQPKKTAKKQAEDESVE